VITGCCRGYCAKGGCDVQGVAGDTALLRDRVPLVEMHHPYNKNDYISGRTMQNRA